MRGNLSIDQLRHRVVNWEESIRDDSELYSRLALHVAGNDEILDLIRSVRPGQLEMNMLLAAVQFLLIENPAAELARFYPSLGGKDSGADLEGTFASFVANYRAEIQNLISTRQVQTNEVARCVFLAPAYNLIADLVGAPLALLEIGTSAGLNLNVDRYGYRYEAPSGCVEVNPGAPLQLVTEARTGIPPYARAVPKIVWRAGIDLNPIDVVDRTEAMWLRALVWPDQVERHRRLARAIEMAALHPPDLRAGDALDLVESVVDETPADAVVVIQHSLVLNQFTPADRERLFATLDSIGERRPTFRVGAEWLERIKGPMLEIARHRERRAAIKLGRVHHHGRWIEVDVEPELASLRW